MQRLPVLAAVSLTVAVEIEVWLTGPPATSVVAGLAPLALAAGRRRPLTVLLGITGAVMTDSALGGVLMNETGFIFLAVLCAAVFAGLFARDTIRLAVAAAVTAGADDARQSARLRPVLRARRSGLVDVRDRDADRCSPGS